MLSVSLQFWIWALPLTAQHNESLQVTAFKTLDIVFFFLERINNINLSFNVDESIKRKRFSEACQKGWYWAGRILNPLTYLHSLTQKLTHLPICWIIEVHHQISSHIQETDLLEQPGETIFCFCLHIPAGAGLYKRQALPRCCTWKWRLREITQAQAGPRQAKSEWSACSYMEIFDLSHCKTVLIQILPLTILNHSL